MSATALAFSGWRHRLLGQLLGQHFKLYLDSLVLFGHGLGLLSEVIRLLVEQLKPATLHIHKFSKLAYKIMQSSMLDEVGRLIGCFEGRA